MKKAYTALALAFLLALSLCSPAMAAMEYGVIYDETESLGSQELTMQGEQALPQLSQTLGLDLRVDVLTQNSYDGLGDAAAGTVCLLLLRKMKSVHQKAEADAYLTAGGLHLTKQYDRYTHTTETRTKIQKENSGGSGGSTYSESGGGGSGRSGKF